MPTITITGTVDKGSMTVINDQILVEIWDIHDRFKERCGADYCDSSGNFSITVKQDLNFYFRADNEGFYFRVYVEGRLLTDTRKNIVWTVGELGTPDIELEDSKTYITQTGKKSKVSGKVTYPQSSIIPWGVKVMVYDLDITEDILLGTTMTNENGEFEVEIAGNHPQPNIIAKAYNDLAPVPAEVGVSNIIKGFSENYSLNIELTEHFFSTNEYDTISDRLDIFYDLESGDDIKAFNDMKLTVVSNEIMLPLSNINILKRAALFKETLDSETDEFVFYGLLRAGFSETTEGLYHVKLNDLIAKITLAVELSYIEEMETSEIEDAAEEIFSRLNQSFADVQLGYSNASTKDILMTGTDVTAEAAAEVIKLFRENGDDTDAFYAALAASESEDLTEEIKTLIPKIIKSNAIMQGSKGMVAQLVAVFDEEEYAEITIEDTVDLVKLTSGNWNTMVGLAVTANPADVYPTNYPEATGPEAVAIAAANKARLVKTITRNLEMLHPTEYLIARMDDDEHDLAAKMSTFKSNNADFDIEQTNLKTYFETASFTGITGVEDFKHDMHTLQRRFSLAQGHERYETVKVLEDIEIDSSYKIARMSYSGFRNVFLDAGGTEEEAGVMYERASRNTALLTVLPSMYNSDVKGLPASIGEIHGDSSYLEDNLIDDDPNLANLFGSQDYCSCKHCRSVYSPSAYLADTFEYLKEAKTATTTSYDVLMERRPELCKLRLSCKNADTPLPYIDLVNEILEVAMAKSSASGLSATFDNNYPATLQTNGKSEELMAHPEHRWDYVYDSALTSPTPYVLDNTVFPWSLPFQLFTEEGRAYLKHLGVSRFEVMDAVCEKIDLLTDPGNAINLIWSNLENQETALEILNLTELERNILNGTYTDLLKTWGNGSGTSIDSYTNTLKSVNVFLNKCSITFNELKELLKSRFFHFGYDDTITSFIEISFSDSDPCNVSGAILKRVDATALTSGDFMRMQRFIRLWRRIKWTVRELDHALMVFKPADPDGIENIIGEELLIKLSQIVRLQRELKLPLHQIISFFGNIYTGFPDDDAENIRSPYELLFFNKNKYNPPSGNFELNAGRDGFLIPSTTVEFGSVNTEVVKAGLGISTDKLLAIAKLLLTVTPDPDENLSHWSLSFENLSLLYRHVSLAKAFKIDPYELVLFKTEFEIDIFEEAGNFNPVLTLQFIYRIKQLLVNKTGLAELMYLRGDISNDLTLSFIPDDSKVNEDIKALSNELEKIRISYEDVKDFDDTITEKRLQRLKGISLITPPVNPYPLTFETVYMESIMGALRNPDTTVSAPTAFQELSFDSLIELINTANLDIDNEQVKNILFNPAFIDIDDPTITYIEPVSLRLSFINDLLGRFLLNFELKDKVLTFVSNTFNIERNLAQTLVSNDVYLKGTITTGSPDIGETVIINNFLLLTADESAPNYDTILSNINGDYKNLHRVSLLINKLGLDIRSFPYFVSGSIPALSNHAIQIDKISVPDIPWLLDDFIAVKQSIDLSKELPDNGNYLPDYLKESSEVSIAQLSDWFGYRTEDIEPMVEAFGFSGDPVSYFNRIEYFEALQQAFKLMDITNANAQKLIDWSLTLALTASQSKEIINSIRSKYDDKAWLKIAKPLRDILRDKQADALSDWLVAHAGLAGVNERADLYAYFLFDTEMTSCMVTSRMVLAMSSVQLFVMRCLLNLEAEVAISDYTTEHWAEWKWRKNYRVWEANRKVFCYPENWIEPELRDNKSEFFVELEAELNQGDINAENVEKAYMAYLQKVQDVSNIEILGMTRKEEGSTISPAEDTFYIFGRTKNKPGILYYRIWDKRFSFSDWKKIEIDFEGNNLIPAYFNNRLTLFWPIIKNKSRSVPVSYGNGSATIDYFEIQIAYSYLTSIGWTTKKIMNTTYLHDLDGMQYQRIDGNIFITKYLRKQEGMIDLRVLVETQKPWVGNVPVDRINDKGCFHVYADFSSYFEKQPWAHTISKSIFGFDYFEAWHPINQHIIQAPHDNYETINETIASPFYGYNTDGVGIKDIFLFGKTGMLPYVITFHDEAINSNIGILNYPFIFQEGSYCYLVKTDLVSKSCVFSTFFHPYIDQFIMELAKNGVEGLLNPMYDATNPDSFQSKLQRQLVIDDTTFIDNYSPNYMHTPATHEIEFQNEGAYSVYNWEIFFHIPMLIADKLSRNQQFSEAQKWYHYVFNPTDNSTYTAPQKYWNTKPFFELYNAGTPPSIQKLMDLLNGNDTEMIRQVEAWRANPFKPHVIARLRLSAYMKTTVMKYIDNLINWGDILFRQDTMESTNEAMQLYVLANYILGKRPVQIDGKEVEDKSYCELITEGGFDDFSNAMIALEDKLNMAFSGNGSIASTEFKTRSGSLDANSQYRSYNGDSKYQYYKEVIKTPEGVMEYSSFPGMEIGSNGMIISHRPKDWDVAQNITKTLYFCTPHNEKLDGYWDLVADRLFKLRNCMNIEGRVRQLPLFSPPIDPAALVRAAAAGLDIGSILADFNAPLPNYRFSYLLAKAKEFIGTVKSLGQSILSAYEKRDAEAMALLKSGNEIDMMEAIVFMKKLQIDEAKANLAAAEKSLPLALAKQTHYSTRQFMNEEEKRQEEMSKKGNLKMNIAASLKVTAGAVAPIPKITAAVGYAAAVHTNIVSGQVLSKVLEMAAESMQGIAAYNHQQASLAGVMAGYKRRAEDWVFQASLAKLEIEQIEKQIAAAEIRISIAEKDLENHEQTIEQRKAEFQYLKTKFTNKQLYDWMVGQLSSTYFQSYQLAYDMAKKTERCFKYEMPECEDSFVGYGYWDSLKKGLLAGERIENDLQRMEVNYMDRNARTYELSKNVSLALIHPEVLAELRETGKCTFTVPEGLFDLDHPGHFMRRIKSVSITIPCVAGPYAGVTARLTLGKNYIRLKPVVGDLEAVDADPTEIRQNLSYMQSIATSTAQNDSGMFNLNFNDERYLPFEGAGVANSEWILELPGDYRNFDYRTIGDVILTVNYTAKDGGDIFKGDVVTGLDSLFTAGINAPVHQRIFSLKHEFGTQWHELLNDTDNILSTNIPITKEHYPYIFRNNDIKVIRQHAIVQFKSAIPASTVYITISDWNSLGLTVNKIEGDLPMASGRYNTGLVDETTAIFEAQVQLSTYTLLPTPGSYSTPVPKEDIENIYIIFDYTVS